MARSDSSDSEYERRRKIKKRERRRSSSSESSSRRRSRKSSRDRRRSRSRSRSRSRDRRRNRSRSRSRDRSRRERRERSISYDRRSRKNEESSSSIKHEKGLVKSNTRDSSSSSSLREKINALTMKPGGSDIQSYKPSEEEIKKIEKESFVQEHFSKTYNQDNPLTTRSKKKKKKKKQQQLQIKDDTLMENNVSENVKISHDDAIFGMMKDTLHLSKFATKSEGRFDKERIKELKSLEDGNDLIFGAMFCEKPEIRQQRWLEKLRLIRQRLLKEGF